MRGNPRCLWCAGTGQYEILADPHRSSGIVPCVHTAEESDMARAAGRVGGAPPPAPPPAERWEGAARPRDGGAATPTAPPGGGPLGGSAGGRVRWEYCLVDMFQDHTARVGQLCAVGRDGWELVCIDRGAAYMRRPCL